MADEQKTHPAEAANPLRTKFPVTARLETSSGPMAVPFHMDAAKQNVMVGTVPAELAAKTVADGGVGELYEPIVTAEGKGVIMLWVMDYEATTCGAYQEFVFTVFVQRKGSPAPKLPKLSSPEAYAMILMVPGVFGFIERLFLNKMEPVVYGRELLSLDKNLELMESNFEYGKGNSVKVRSTFGGEPLVSLDMGPEPGALGKVGSAFRVARAVGFGRMTSLGMAEVNTLQMITKPGIIESQGDAVLHLSLIHI